MDCKYYNTPHSYDKPKRERTYAWMEKWVRGKQTSEAIVEPDEVKRADLVYQMWDIHESDGPFFIGTVANYPSPTYLSNKLKGVPTHDQLKLGGFVNPWIIPYPSVTNPETYSFA